MIPFPFTRQDPQVLTEETAWDLMAPETFRERPLVVGLLNSGPPLARGKRASGSTRRFILADPWSGHAWSEMGYIVTEFEGEVDVAAVWDPSPELMAELAPGASLPAFALVVGNEVIASRSNLRDKMEIRQFVLENRL